MPNLNVDVSHPWDGKNPIKRPKWNPDTIPTEQEVIEVLEYFLSDEPELIIAILTEVDINDFFTEGIVRNAVVQRSS